MTFKKFSGINNVLPPERLGADELTLASNVDIGPDGQIRRRAGFAVAAAGSYRNVWEGAGFTLAVLGSDLVNTATLAVLHAGIGTARIWYCNLPDGRTLYTNGTVSGVTNGAARTPWGVPIPAALGTAADVAGNLAAGNYQYSLTYVRNSDGLEGGPAYSAPVAIAAGGLALTALPVLTGYSINVYLTSHYGGQGYFAGNAVGSTFTFTGKNSALVMPCRTDFMQPAPAGILPAMWNGRVLLAVGNVLYASQHARFELFDMRRDFKQFSGAITAIVKADDGVYVGTTKELAFLRGEVFEKLAFNQVVEGPVVLGSGVGLQGENIGVGNGVGSGQAGIFIANGIITAGFNGGQVALMTQGRYVTDAAEVAATFRTVNGVPQYIAVKQ